MTRGVPDRLPVRVRASNRTRGTVLGASLEVSESFVGRFLGLMGRRELPGDGGMWLRPASSIHMLFMRFPIDVVFLARAGTDGGRRVVSLRPNLRPWTSVVWWARGADGCLELPVGAIEASDTVVGDLVTLDPTARDGTSASSSPSASSSASSSASASSSTSPAR